MSWAVVVLMLVGSQVEVYSSAVAANQAMCRNVERRVNQVLRNSGRYAVCMQMRPQAPEVRAADRT